MDVGDFEGDGDADYCARKLFPSFYPSGRLAKELEYPEALHPVRE